MLDGKYAAISGAIARMQNLDNISERLASAKIPGYKKSHVTFASRLDDARSGMATNGTNFTRLAGQVIDFSNGHMEHTGLSLDVAINGDGFFQMQRPDGEFSYTRAGSFKLNTEGQLYGSQGYPVIGVDGNEIFLPDADVTIRVDGTVWNGEEQVAQIALYLFEDRDTLQRAENGMFFAADGAEPVLHPAPEVIQRNIESSNVNMMEELTRMTANLRVFEANQKALRIYSDMNTKAAELGLLQ